MCSQLYKTPLTEGGRSPKWMGQILAARCVVSYVPFLGSLRLDLPFLA
jgi:hypothetical protein